MTGKKGWFKVTNAAGSEPAELVLYGIVGGDWFGDGIVAEDVIKAVKALNLKPTDTLRVRINSIGGDYIEGIAIYNYLNGLKANVNVLIDGWALSAASLIAMAGDVIEMPANTYMMIHSISTLMYGNATQFRKQAELMDQLQEGGIETYLARVGKNVTREELIQMLEADDGDGTWLSARQAVEYGFADKVIEELKAAAFADFESAAKQYHPPQAVQEAIKARIQSQRARLEALRITGK